MCKIFASPSFPDYVGICLSRFECFPQVMITFTEWHEWFTRVLSSWQEINWCERCQIFGVVNYCCQGSCVECLFHKTHFCAQYLVGKACVVQDLLQSWPYCNFEPFFPRFQTIFSHSQSYLCPTRSWMFSAQWLLQRSFLRCHWWWCSGSHALHWILSLQLDMTRCPMAVGGVLPRCQASEEAAPSFQGTS